MPAPALDSYHDAFFAGLVEDRYGAVCSTDEILTIRGPHLYRTVVRPNDDAEATQVRAPLHGGVLAVEVLGASGTALDL